MTPRTIPAPHPAQPPIDAIREAVRSELGALEQALVRCAAEAVVDARLKASRMAFESIARLLAVRFMLMLAMVGGFVLAVMALRLGTYEAAAVLVAYAVLVLIPLIWLERGKG